LTKQRKRPAEEAAKKPGLKHTSEPLPSRRTIQTSTANHATTQETLAQHQDNTTEVDGAAEAPSSTTCKSVEVHEGNTQPPTSTAPRRPTCFLDLPAELRNQIYTIALQRPIRLSIDKMKIPPLAQAHEQIRREAMSIFLGINSFKLELVIQPRGNRVQLRHCCSDGKLRGLGLDLGYIADLQISVKLDTYRHATWKVLVPSSGGSRVDCTGKLVRPHNGVDNAAVIAQKIKKSVTSWLKEKDQPGLGLEEIWSILCFFKMEYIDLLR